MSGSRQYTRDDLSQPGPSLTALSAAAFKETVDQNVEEDDSEKLLPNQTFYLLVHPFEGKVVNLKY